MEGIKSYQKPKGYVLDTIYDIIELQNGRLILSDAKLGRVQYRVAMYGYFWELLYTVAETGRNRCDVTLRIIGDRHDKAREIRREFALLESMLGEGVKVKISDN